MAAGCIHDTLQELLLKINTIHHTYLSEEKQSVKLKYRNSLQKYIHELLCIVPHHQKFNFSETADILYRSIQKIKGYNLLKLANAWIALATYANNLYTQPWRKEFHEITTYCGYYKHQVESYLIGAEKMLEIMGYVYKPEHKWVFNPSTDSDLISAASQDSIIALTECQVIFAIYKEVSKKVPTCTLADILEHRQSHICSIDEAIQDIYYLHYRTTSCYCNSHSDSCVSLPYVQYPPCCSTSHHGSSTKSLVSKNGYRSYSTGRNGTVTIHRKKANECNVPTAKLINIDSSNTNYSSHPKKSGCDQRTYDPHLNAYPKHIDRHSSADMYQSSCSISNASSDFKCDREISKDNELGKKEKFNDMRNDPQLKYGSSKSVHVSEALHNLKLSSELEQNAHYNDTVDGTKNIAVRNGIKINDVSKQCLDSNSNIKSGNSMIPNETWECNTCTYHNHKKSQVCEICGKSRTVGSESKPLISGGKQCPHCTLVNSKDSMVCEACSNSLKDSPTYI